MRKAFVFAGIAAFLTIPTMNARADDACVLPLIVAKADKPDITLRIALKAHDAYLSVQDQSFSCEEWFRFLRDVAHTLKVAAEANRSAYAQKELLEKERVVRIRLFTDMNDADYRSSDPSLYRSNTKRLGDLYQKQGEAKSFLDDVVMQDQHFAKYGRTPELRKLIRHAIYSCDKWDFTYTRDIRNMNSQWALCSEDFRRYRASFSAFREIAPDAHAYLEAQASKE